MKKLFVLLLGLVFLLNCSKHNSLDTQDITGKWKLIKGKTAGFGEPSVSFDLSKENIVYHFKPDSVLKITGKGGPYPSGEHHYFFGEDYIGGYNPILNDPKILLVKINNLRWSYSLTRGEMTLGRSYVDGADYSFIKIY